MLPSVETTKKDGGTGVTRPAATGVLAIVAPGEKGDINTAVAYTRKDVLKADMGLGRLTHDGAYVQALTKKQILAIRGSASTPGDYSAITKSGGGTSVITEGATVPFDDFAIEVLFTVGATIGVAGAKYKYRINGGAFSKELALGTATTIAIPDTGASLALGAGTVVVGTKAEFKTTGPQLENTDLPAALEALRVTTQPFEAVLVDAEADAATVTLINQWLLDIQKAGKFKTAVLTARPRDPLTETEPQYLAALAAMLVDSASLDIVLCADLADTTSPFHGFVQARPTGLFVAARGMSIRLGTDPAWVQLGPLPDVSIRDSRGNPKYHDENTYPGLDDVRITTLRTFDGDEFTGVYITNAKLLSPGGSDFVYWQHARTMNRGCELAHSVLTKQLSRGVRKKPKPGPNGERYIDEGEALQLEALGNAAIDRELVQPGEVDDMKLFVHRDDDIRSNQGAEINVSLQSVSLGYIKKFKVAAGYVTAIDAPLPAQ